MLWHQQLRRIYFSVQHKSRSGPAAVCTYKPVLSSGLMQVLSPLFWRLTFLQDEQMLTWGTESFRCQWVMSSPELWHGILKPGSNTNSLLLSAIAFINNLRSTLHASFPPAWSPAQIMFAVMFPSNESLLLHLAGETTGTVTVLSVAGTWPPPAPL